MSKRTLSDSELHAQSKNRHAQRHLQLQLEQLKQSEHQLRENTRAETEKWMQFRRSNLRNSGWCPEALGVGEEDFEDVVVLELPGSPTIVKARSELNGSEKFQRPWAYTYSARSHNKLYNDLLHSSDNNKKKLSLLGKGDKTPRFPADQPKLAQQVPAVTGIERAKTAWGRRTKLLSARDCPPRPHTAAENDATSVEFSELNTTRNTNTSWGSLVNSVTRVKAAWAPRRKFLEDQEEDSDAPTDYTPRLAKSVSTFQKLLRTRDIWICSICGGDKRNRDEEQSFSSVAFMAKGVVRATTALHKVKSSENVSTTIYPEDTPRSLVSTGRKMKCGCLKRAAASNAWANIRTAVDDQNGLLSPIQTSFSDENGSTPLLPTPRSDPVEKETGTKPQSAKKKLNGEKLLSNATAKSTGHFETPVKSKSKNRKTSREEGKSINGLKVEDIPHEFHDNDSTKPLLQTQTEERKKNGKERRVPSVVENGGSPERVDPKHKRKRRVGVVNSPRFTSEKNANTKKDTISLGDLATDLPNTPLPSVNRARKGPNAKTNGNGEQTHNKLFSPGKNTTPKGGSDSGSHSGRHEGGNKFTFEPLQKEQSDYLERTSFASQGDELSPCNGVGSDDIAEAKNAKKISGNVPNFGTTSDLPARGKEIDIFNNGDPRKEGEDGASTEPYATTTHTVTPQECASGSNGSCHESQLQLEGENAAVNMVSQANGVRDVNDTGSVVSKLPFQEILGDDKIGATSTTIPCAKHMETVAGAVIRLQRSNSKSSTGRRMSWRNVRHRMKNAKVHEDNVFVKIARVMQARRKSRRPHTTALASTNASSDISDTPQRPQTTGNSTSGFDDQGLVRKKNSTNSEDGNMHDTKMNQNQNMLRRGRKNDFSTADNATTDDGRQQSNNQRVSVSSGKDIANDTVENRRNVKDSINTNKIDFVDHTSNNINGNNNYNNNKNNANINISQKSDRPSLDVSADNSNTNVNNNDDNNILNNNDNSNGSNSNTLDNGTFEETYTSSKSLGVLDYDNRDLEVVGFPSKQVFHRGVRIRNYVAPQQRYKTVARDRHKRMVSVRWNSAEGAVVTEQKITEKPGLVDVVFPKQARQRALTKLVEENHSKPTSHAAEMADAALRMRITQFLESVEPYCK